MLEIVSYIKMPFHYNYNTTVQIITAWEHVEYLLKIAFLEVRFCLLRVDLPKLNWTKGMGNKRGDLAGYLPYT